MGWLRRTPKKAPRIETELGTFEYDGVWQLLSANTPLGRIRICVGNETFDPGVLPKTGELLAEIASWSEKALAHIGERQPETLTDYGSLMLESLDITDLQTGEFSIEYGFAEWPDGTVSVVFRNGRPIDIWIGD